MSFPGFFRSFLLFSAKNIDFFSVLRYNEKKTRKEFPPRDGGNDCTNDFSRRAGGVDLTYN